MPVEPDKLDVILAVTLDIRKNQEELLAKLETGIPPTQPPDAANAFADKWQPVTAAEFTAKYGVAPAAGTKIPPMLVYDEAEAIYRARAFYTTQGTTSRRITTPEKVYPAIEIIANATQETATQFYECGGGKALTCFPDTLAYVWYVGACDTQQEYAASLGAGKAPAAYAGITIAHLLAPNFSGGGPSGTPMP